MLCPRCNRGIPDDAALCCYCGRTIVKKQQAHMHQRGNGSGGAYRRGKTWTAFVTIGWSIDENGISRQKRFYKGGFKTRNEALAYIPTLKSRIDGNREKAPTLEHYWDMYYQHEFEKLSRDRQMAYKIAWKKMADIQYIPVDKLTVQNLRDVVSSKASTHYPARDMKTVLRHLFNLAGADRWVNKDLPDFIVLPELNEKERCPFTEEEQQALWRIYDNGDTRAAVPLIMIYTGMMPGEMQSLKINMIDLEAQQITGVGMKTKVRKSAPVYLPDTIIPVLYEEMQVSTSPSGYVWVRNEKKFYNRYYEALEAAGCRRLEPYSCRHTTATALAITENIAPRTIQKVMRWSTTKMLDRYAHPDDKDALNAINTLKR